MANIFDAQISSSRLATRWNNNALDRQPYFFEGFFPVRKQIGLDLSYFKGKRMNIRPLDLSSFDAKVMPIARGNFDKVSTEMPFFKNSLNVNESERQELLKVMQTGNQAYIDVVLNKVYNDGERLLENARVIPEIMRAQLMTTGQIAFASNGQAVSYDFGVTNKGNASTVWTNASADPIADISAWQDVVEEETGVRPTGLAMNRVTLNELTKVTEIKNGLYVLANGTVTPTVEEVKRYILAQTGCTIYVYSKGYNDPATGNFTKFIGDGVVVLFPEDMNLGETVYGTTPEEADLLGGASKARVDIVDGGIAISEYVQEDPVMKSLKVSEVVLATLEATDYIYIADVNHTA